jgi:hypothetical protein
MHVLAGDSMSTLFTKVPCHRILISAFDYDTKRALFFRSYATKGSSRGQEDLRIIDAIHASSTPPVMYFDRPAEGIFISFLCCSIYVLLLELFSIVEILSAGKKEKRRAWDG